MGTVPAFTSTTVAAGITAPSLGSTLVSVTVPSGAYAVAYVAYYTGTTDTSKDPDNIALQTDPTTGGSFVTAQTMLMQPIVNAPLVFVHFLVYALTTIKLIAVVAGGASCAYHAQLAAVTPGPAGAFL